MSGRALLLVVTFAHGVLGEVIRPGEGAAAPDRPGDWRGIERQLCLDFIQYLERIPCLAIHLVHESDDWNVAQAADLEQFERARLDALRGVDHHHRTVDSSQRPVSIVSEILVAWRIEKIENVVAILKGHHRSHDRNAALALDLHPVGARLHSVLLGFHLAGKLDRAAEQQQLFGQRRLARVRVRNDREGAAAGDRLGHDFSHDEEFQFDSARLLSGRYRPVEPEMMPPMADANLTPEAAARLPGETFGEPGTLPG